jgi:hypothetical protein
MALRYFSNLTPKQKDATHKRICEMLADRNHEYIHPSLWGILFNTSFDEIMATKAEADKYCKGRCILFGGLRIPITVKTILQPNK